LSHLSTSQQSTNSKNNFKSVQTHPQQQQLQQQNLHQHPAMHYASLLDATTKQSSLTASNLILPQHLPVSAWPPSRLLNASPPSIQQFSATQIKQQPDSQPQQQHAMQQSSAVILNSSMPSRSISSSHNMSQSRSLDSSRNDNNDASTSDADSDVEDENNNSDSSASGNEDTVSRSRHRTSTSRNGQPSAKRQRAQSGTTVTTINTNHHHLNNHHHSTLSSTYAASQQQSAIAMIDAIQNAISPNSAAVSMTTASDAGGKSRKLVRKDKAKHNESESRRRSRLRLQFLELRSASHCPKKDRFSILAHAIQKFKQLEITVKQLVSLTSAFVS
jgi:hypothetical protein